MARKSTWNCRALERVFKIKHLINAFDTHFRTMRSTGITLTTDNANIVNPLSFVKDGKKPTDS
jgi:hypothetical protein